MCYVWNKEHENHGTVLASIVQSTRNLSVICPYIRAVQVNDLLGDSELQSLKVITLWSFRTFLAGSSEPEALRHLLELGGQVRTMSSGLHAKVYIADESALVTSANLTGGGLVNNLECGLVLRGRAAVSALEQQFELEWRRATPLNVDHVAQMIAALNQERARSDELLEHLEELEQRLSEVVSGSPSVWTPQEDEIVVRLEPEQMEFLQRPLRGQGGYQTLLARLQDNMDGDRLRLTRTDCERVVRYGTRYGQGGFQTRLQSIVQLAQQFIS